MRQVIRMLAFGLVFSSYLLLAAGIRCDCNKETAGYLVLTEKQLARAVKHIDPILMPPNGNQIRLQGVIVLKIRFDALGKVDCVQLVSGDPMVVDQARAAVLRWTFKPVRLESRTYGGCGTLRVAYRLGLAGNSTTILAHNTTGHISH